MNESNTRIQQFLLALLRIAVGWHFTYEGMSKLMAKNWSSSGYLEVSRWFFSDFFHWIAATPAALKIVNLAVPWMLLCIGLGLILGMFTRLAGVGGILMLAFFWVANPPLTGLGLAIPTEGSYVIVDKNLVELFALAVVIAFRGRSVGLDAMMAGKAVAPPPAVPAVDPERRLLAAGFSGVPFLGAFAVAAIRKEQWRSYEARNLMEAAAAPSAKTLNVASLADLKGPLQRARSAACRSAG